MIPEHGYDLVTIMQKCKIWRCTRLSQKGKNSILFYTEKMKDKYR